MIGEATNRLLVVEDELHLLAGLEINLSLEGYQVQTATSLEGAREALESEPVDLILLDLMLPDGSGLDLCGELRARRNFTPIIILTAKGAATDIVEGLEGGADDYLTKPFNLGEVLSRIRVTLRRLHWDAIGETNQPATTIGDAVVSWEAHEFERGGKARRLTGLEIRLLSHFVEHAGRTLTREDLLRDVWGLSGYQTRTVDNFVARMRKYFEPNPAHPRHFLTVRGIGYRFEL